MEMIKVKTVDQARNKAIQWQSWQSNRSLSYEDLIIWQKYFLDLAKQFNLTDEFLENGII